MAVPTISTITPNGGAPTGRQAVEITGTNFQLPPAPAVGIIPVPVAAPTVRVTFGGVEAARVDVISATRVFAFAPRYTLPFDSNGDTVATTAVDVVLENIDTGGVLIPGETVTSAGGYTYTRPGITHQDSGDLMRAVVAIVDLLRSQVLANTVINTSVDYDPDTGAPMIQVEETPQLVLAGPTLSFNSFFTYRGDQTVSTDVATEFLKQRRHRVVDLEFTVSGFTNSEVELINLQALLETALDRTSTVDVDLDADDPAAGVLALELHITQSPQYVRVENYAASDLRMFTAGFVLKGLPLNTLPGVAQDGVQAVVSEVTEEPTLEAVLQIGDNLPAAQGAPTRSPPD
jgi:hypothetical protein